MAIARLSGQEPPSHRRTLWLYAFFFLSGFPALLYQLVWQRALFTIYGINIESVTMVVSAFMLGLGLGSLVGGWISQRPGVPLLMLFGLAELGIGACGFISLTVFRYVAEFTAGTSALGTGLITFVLLMIPTALMGCTLPLLTEYLVRISGNVGRSVGALYFVNTLGSATACFAALLFIMNRFGETGSVRLAAVFNAAVGITVLILHFAGKTGARETQSAALSAQENEDAGRTPSLALQTLPFTITIPIAALSGFVALGYEILWYRAFSIAIAGRALAFAALLAFYLAGIAFGSLVSRMLCHRLTRGAMDRHLRNLAMFVIGANMLSYAILPSVGYLNRYRVVMVLPFIALAAALLGATFPLICHAGVKPDDRAGRGLSWLYVSNIIGSTLGSFVVGYILMDIWPVRSIAIALAITGLALGASMLIASEKGFSRRALAVGISCGLAVAIVAASGPLFYRFYESLEAHPGVIPDESYRDIVETKSGVITVHQDLTVYGSGGYDGKINTDLVNDINGLVRPASISYWHPAPREVLIIGLSTGAWAQVIANNPQVEKVTTVEINPGYLRLIRKYPQVRSLLDNPKVTVYIDDGRRWLVRNKLAKFDVIVSNTTFHWRANISNLLSREFLELVRSHLKPGGAMIYNLTASAEAQLTGLTVFPYGMRMGSCLVVSDSPLQYDLERWKSVVLNSRIDGKPLLDLNKPEDRQRFDETIAMYTSSRRQDELRATSTAHKLITDDNMGTEWAGPFKSKWGSAAAAQTGTH